MLLMTRLTDPLAKNVKTLYFGLWPELNPLSAGVSNNQFPLSGGGGRVRNGDVGLSLPSSIFRTYT